MSDLNSPETDNITQEVITPDIDIEKESLRMHAVEYEAFLKTLTGFNQKVDHVLDKDEKLRLALLFFDLKPVMSTNNYGYLYSDLPEYNPRFGSTNDGQFIFNRAAVNKVIKSNPDQFTDFQGRSLESYLASIKSWSKYFATTTEKTKAGLLYGFPNEAVIDFVEEKENLLHFNKYGIQFNYSSQNTEVIAKYDSKIRNAFQVLNVVRGFHPA